MLPDPYELMTLSGLLDVAATDPALSVALTGDPGGPLDLVAPPSLRPILGAALARDRGRTVLMVTATEREAEDLTAALSSLLDPAAVAGFPAWETLPHERLSPRSDTVGQRLAVLRRLAHGDPDDPAAGPLQAVVAPVRAVLQPIVSGLGDLEPVRLRPQDEAELEVVVRRLVNAGYRRVDLVEKRGEIAVRGGILDVFPPTEEHPLRVEFWGDQVEEVRYFKAADQRSLEASADGLWAPPCRELPLTPSVRERAKDLAAEHPALAEVLDRSPTVRPSRAWRRSRRCSPTAWSCWSTRCRPARPSSSATPSASAPAPPSSSGPARSSSKRPG